MVTRLEDGGGTTWLTGAEAASIPPADGVTIYTAKDLKVGLFSPEQLEAQMK